MGVLLCSYDCYKSRRIRAGHDIRETLFELERGVCQIWVSTHTHVSTFQCLDEYVAAKTISFQTLASIQDKEQVEDFDDPRVIFGRGDHIVPVVEGGGTCDISNLRTLCTPCHEKERR